jgi:hypothetical protein
MGATMTRLFDLAAEYRAAAEQLSDLDLPDDVVADTLESISGDLTTKATNIAMLVTNWRGDLEAIRAHEKAVADRRRALEARIGRLEGYLLVSMQVAHISTIEGPALRLRVRDNPPSVEVFDAGQVPVSFWRQKPPPPPEVDKQLIAHALKAGEDVPGCRLRQNQRLEIK